GIVHPVEELAHVVQHDPHLAVRQRGREVAGHLDLARVAAAEPLDELHRVARPVAGVVEAPVVVLEVEAEGLAGHVASIPVTFCPAVPPGCPAVSRESAPPSRYPRGPPGELDLVRRLRGPSAAMRIQEARVLASTY